MGLWCCRLCDRLIPRTVSERMELEEERWRSYWARSESGTVIDREAAIPLIRDALLDDPGATNRQTTQRLEKAGKLALGEQSYALLFAQERRRLGIHRRGPRRSA